MNTKKAFTMIELLVVISILMVISTLIYQSMRPMLVRSNVVSETVKFKNMVNRSKASALENTAPVLVDLSAGTLLSVVDLDRGGNFGFDANNAEDINELVLGESLTTGIGLNDETGKVRFVEPGDTDLGTDPIPHPSGAYDIDPTELDGYSTFENDQFILTAQGLVRSADPPNALVSGSFFLKSSDGFLLSLIHVTGMGEVRIALKNRNEDEWVWQ